jgi:tetratricopeptide (TPR) repeat protein
MSPRTIDLHTAVYEIRTAYPNRQHSQPFFFIVGAGISTPTVPLASQIVEACRLKVGDQLGLPVPPAKPLDQYSFWFDRAYPQLIDRQRYLRTFIENKPLPDACLRLAHLLGSGQIANLLVTPNFDDFVGRALGIFSSTYSVCDHPETVDRINLVSADLKIVHVHGSYKFYDCLNLTEEIASRARLSAVTTRTMAAFLDRALSFSSPLVVGYSGWEDDVIMSALRRRLSGSSLPYRAYWFCHTNESVHDLQARVPWLVDHPDVRLVVPSVPERQPESSTASAFDSSTDPQPMLSARSVFEELSRAFTLTEPELTVDPLGFFARQLRATLPIATGTYSFAAVIERVDRAVTWDARLAPEANASVAAGMELARKLVRTSEYRAALLVLESIMDKELREVERTEIHGLVESHFADGETNADDALLALDLLMRLADTLPRLKESPNYLLKLMRRITKKGETLFQMGQYLGSLKVFDTILETFGPATDPEVDGDIAYVKSRKALVLGRLGRRREEVDLYDAIISQLKATRGLQPLLMQSQFNRCMSLIGLDERAAALSGLREFSTAYIEEVDDFAEPLVVAAMDYAADILEHVGGREEAATVLTKMFRRYGASPRRNIQRTVARALLRLAHIQEDTAGPQEVLTTLDWFGGYIGVEDDESNTRDLKALVGILQKRARERLAKGPGE